MAVWLSFVVHTRRLTSKTAPANTVPALRPWRTKKRRPSRYRSGCAL
jgi:hypothetical protein